MNKRRLLTLACLLEKDAKNKNGIQFDLNAWGYAPSGKPTLDCGTQACAVGLAAISGKFPDFHYVMWSGIPVPTYRDHRGFSAVELYFGLTDKQSTWLFEPDSYPLSQRTEAKGELAVAKRIRKMIAPR